MILKTEYHVEGLNPDGEWVTISAHVDPSLDVLAQRDEVIRLLRARTVVRYRQVRLVKYVTTLEVIGKDITV